MDADNIRKKWTAAYDWLEKLKPVYQEMCDACKTFFSSPSKHCHRLEDGDIQGQDCPKTVPQRESDKMGVQAICFSGL